LTARRSRTLSNAGLDLGLITEVRDMWQFYRDRSLETYGALASPVPQESIGVLDRMDMGCW